MSADAGASVTNSAILQEAVGWFCQLTIACTCLVLHLAVPAHPTPGYACDCHTGKVLLYRNNAFAVLAAAVATFCLLMSLGAIDGTELAHHQWSMVRAAFTLGLLVSVALYVQARMCPNRCCTLWLWLRLRLWLWLWLRLRLFLPLQLWRWIY